MPVAHFYIALPGTDELNTIDSFVLGPYLRPDLSAGTHHSNLVKRIRCGRF